VLNLKVNIGEKILDQVTPLIKACSDSGGNLLSRGGIISKEDTFTSRHIMNEGRLISIGEGRV
jgi:hypothetical protein